MAIASLGIVIGPKLNIQAFHRGILLTALLMIAGGIISALGIEDRNNDKQMVIV